MGTVEAIDATIESRKGFPRDAVRNRADRRNQRRPEANVASPTGLNVEAPGDPHASRLAGAVLDVRKQPQLGRASSTAPRFLGTECRPQF